MFQGQEQDTNPCLLGVSPVLFVLTTPPTSLLTQMFGLSYYSLPLSLLILHHLQRRGRAAALPGAFHTDAEGCFLCLYLTLRATDKASVFYELGVRTGCEILCMFHCVSSGVYPCTHESNVNVIPDS